MGGCGDDSGALKKDLNFLAWIGALLFGISACRRSARRHPEHGLRDARPRCSPSGCQSRRVKKATLPAILPGTSQHRR